jgi:hypothetical protein
MRIEDVKTKVEVSPVFYVLHFSNPIFHVVVHVGSAGRSNGAAPGSLALGGAVVNGLYAPTRALWYADFRAKLLSFPAGKHDDQVDALGLIGQVLDKKSLHPSRRRNTSATHAVERASPSPLDHSGSASRSSRWQRPAARTDYEHVAGECAEHQQVTLREVDEFGCSVNQHKPKSD